MLTEDKKQIKIKGINNADIYITPSAYQDRLDVDFDTTLFEYGILRNSTTGKTLIGKTYSEGSYTSFVIRNITIELVKEILNNIEEGFFHYIGEDRAEAISNLDDKHLAHAIFSINAYDGTFRSGGY